MELESSQPEAPQVEQTSSLHQVTPLSKYLAMTLFVLLPFVGGYVGYQLAPEKVVEVTREANIEKKALVETDGLKQKEQVKNENSDFKEPRFGTFLLVDPRNYNLGEFKIVPQKNNETVPIEKLTAQTARKISENLQILTIGDGNDRLVPYATVIYDTIQNKIVRQLDDYPSMNSEGWFGLHSRVGITNDNNQQRYQVLFIDYLNGIKEVLYEEQDADVQLYDVCEIGCKGILYITTDAKVVFGRHKKINGTTATRLVETVIIQIPEEYLSDNQKQYMEGAFESSPE